MNDKITTLIPAFRQDYLESVFRGLATQTYKNFSVIVADDSADGIVSGEIRSGKYNAYTSKLDISIIKGAGSELANHNLLLKAWNGDSRLSHIHHDDDYIYPDFYRQHVVAHNNFDITLSASARWIANREGTPLAHSNVPEDITKSNQRYSLISPQFLAKSLLIPVRNWIGEFSNVVISKEILKVMPSLPSINDPYWGMLDMSMYLTNSMYGNNAAYMTDHLSVYRRQGSGVEYLNPQTLSGKIIRFAWIAYAVQAWKNETLNDSDFLSALTNSLRAYSAEMPADEMTNHLADNISSSNGNLQTIAEHLDVAWSVLRADHKFANTPGSKK